MRYSNGKGQVTLSIGVDGNIVVRVFGEAITDKAKRTAAMSISGKLRDPQKVWNAIKYEFRGYKPVT